MGRIFSINGGGFGDIFHSTAIYSGFGCVGRCHSLLGQHRKQVLNGPAGSFRFDDDKHRILFYIPLQHLLQIGQQQRWQRTMNFRFSQPRARRLNRTILTVRNDFWPSLFAELIYSAAGRKSFKTTTFLLKCIPSIWTARFE